VLFQVGKTAQMDDRGRCAVLLQKATEHADVLGNFHTLESRVTSAGAVVQDALEACTA
jgi:hypothetical protein